MLKNSFNTTKIYLMITVTSKFDRLGPGLVRLYFCQPKLCLLQSDVVGDKENIYV